MGIGIENKHFFDKTDFFYKMIRLFHKTAGFQTVDKPLDYIKMGSQGRSPRQGLGAVAPVKSPFPGERGQGDRDSELEVCFKNRLFLQTKLCLFQAQFLFFAEKLLTIVRNRIIISISPISDLTICRQGESAWITKTTEKNCMNIIMY